MAEHFMYERRNSETNSIIGFEDVDPEHVLGILPCSLPGCQRRTGVACGEIDSRGRLCPTAWCPEHRLVMLGEPMCAFHALRHEPRMRLGTGTSLTEMVERFADLAEDDVASVLQEHAQRVGGLLVSEPLQAVIDDAGELRCWRAWRVSAPAGDLRVELLAEKRRSSEIVISVDGLPVHTVRDARAVVAAASIGGELLLREVLAPVSLAIDVRRSEHSAELPGVGQLRRVRR